MINFICGRSGSGKDTIAKELLEKNPDLQPIVTYTTRPMRPGEIDGKEYHFCDTENLNWYRDTNNIVEERIYHTAQGTWFYFTVNDGQFDLEHKDYLVTGSLEMYQSYINYFGAKNMNLLYLEVPEKQLLLRTIQRESLRTNPNYAEVCRRFYADSKDFSEERLQTLGISKENRIQNTGVLYETMQQISMKMKNLNAPIIHMRDYELKQAQEKIYRSKYYEKRTAALATMRPVIFYSFKQKA